MLLALVGLPVGAQTLAEASAAAKKTPHEWPLSTAGATNVFTNADVTASAEGVSDAFTPTADNIFVCKSRSIKALFTVVSAEQNGYFTQQFASFKLRDNPDLAVAAKADATSCDAGTYIGAMEKALKAAAVESARLQELLKRIK